MYYNSLLLKLAVDASLAADRNPIRVSASLFRILEQAVGKNVSYTFSVSDFGCRSLKAITAFPRRMACAHRPVRLQLHHVSHLLHLSSSLLQLSAVAFYVLQGRSTAGLIFLAAGRARVQKGSLARRLPCQVGPPPSWRVLQANLRGTCMLER